MISKRPDDKGLRPGEVRPIRVPTKAGKARGFNDDPLTKRLTSEVTLSIVWKIRHKDDFFETWERIPGDTWEEKRARILKQLRDTGETQIVEKVSRRTMASLLQNFAKVNHSIKVELQKEVDRYGVEIESCELQSPDIPKAVNKSLARLSSSFADGQTEVTTAQARRVVERERATGEAEGRERLAEAARVEHAKEGEGMKTAAGLLDMDGADYYHGQVAKKALGEGDLVIATDVEAGIKAVAAKTVLRNTTGTDAKGAS